MSDSIITLKIITDAKIENRSSCLSSLDNINHHYGKQKGKLLQKDSNAQEHTITAVRFTA